MYRYLRLFLLATTLYVALHFTFSIGGAESLQTAQNFSAVAFSFALMAGFFAKGVWGDLSAFRQDIRRALRRVREAFGHVRSQDG
jgi:hypothetical protein